MNITKSELARTIVQVILNLKHEPPATHPLVANLAKKDLQWLRKQYLLAEKALAGRDAEITLREVIEGYSPPPEYYITTVTDNFYYVVHDEFGITAGYSTYRDALEFAWEDYSERSK